MGVSLLALLQFDVIYVNRLDPSNTRAREGIERVEKHGDMGVDNAFDVEVEEMENSENEVKTAAAKWCS